MGTIPFRPKQPGPESVHVEPSPKIRLKQITITQHLDDWLGSVSDSTRPSYQKEVKYYVAWSGMEHAEALQKLAANPEQQKAAYKTALKGTKAGSTIKKALAILTSLVEWVQSHSAQPAVETHDQPVSQHMSPGLSSGLRIETSNAPPIPGDILRAMRPAAEIEARTTITEWLTHPYYSAETQATYQGEWSLFSRWMSRDGNASPEHALVALKERPEWAKSYQAAMRSGALLTPKGLRYSASTIRKKMVALAALAKLSGGPAVAIPPNTTPAQNRHDRSGPPPAVVDAKIAQLVDRGTWPSLRDGALLALGAYPGLRLSEALGVKRSDIDFEKLEVSIKPKCGHGEVVQRKLAPEAAAVLQKYLAKCPTPELWIETSGRVMRPANVQQLMKRLQLPHAHGGPGYATYHGLRHTADTRLRDAGVDVDTRVKLLGWLTPKHENIYLH